MIAALEALVEHWPITYIYHACPTCNQLFRCERKDLKYCPECRDKYPDDPSKSDRCVKIQCTRRYVMMS
jgi:hypothetical protein